MMRIDKLILLFAAGAVLPVMHASALTLLPSVGVGMQYTDNARLSASNEEDDWIASGSLAVTVEESGGPLEFNLRGSLFQEHYLNDSFGDQTDLNLGALARWEQIRNRLIWRVDDVFTQTSVDSLGANTPDNSQDTNVFSFGPEIIFPISARNRLTVNPVFRDYYYSETDTDNQSIGVSASWQYSLYPNMDVGLDGSTTWVEYDDELANPDYTINLLQAFVAGTGARTSYRVSLGATSIDRDRAEDLDGVSGSASLLYELTGRTSIDTRISSDLTDTSDNFFDAAIDPNSGSSGSQQVSSDVLRTSTLRVTLMRDDPVLDSRAWVEYQDNDYEEQPFDRKSQSVGIDFGYPVNSRLTTNAYASYNRIEDTDLDRSDKRYTIGGNATYRISRSLSADFDLRYTDEQSTSAANEYDEFRGFLGLVYGFGRTGEIPRAGRQARY
jgi:hypothetical protein